MSGPDLFVVCKSCGAEVSPYITECPYCGERLRKRAPKLDKPAKAGKPGKLPKAPRMPRAPRVARRPRADGPHPRRVVHRDRGEYALREGWRPWGTIVLVLAAVLTTVTGRGALFSFNELVLLEPLTPGLDAEPWRAVTTLFVFLNTGHEAVVLGVVFLFGWLLERRHGALAVVVIFLVSGGAGVVLASAVDANAAVLGCDGAALGLLAAWAVRDLLTLRRRQDISGDLLGVAALAALVLSMPLAVQEAHWAAATGGLLTGLLLGFPLARLASR